MTWLCETTNMVSVETASFLRCRSSAVLLSIFGLIIDQNLLRPTKDFTETCFVDIVQKLLRACD